MGVGVDFRAIEGEDGDVHQATCARSDGLREINGSISNGIIQNTAPEIHVWLQR